MIKDLRKQFINFQPTPGAGIEEMWLKKFSILKNNFSQKDIVILTCGPSLLEYSLQEIKNFCKNKVVFCVKQTIHNFKDICDVHFYNDNNITLYEYNENTVSISSSNHQYKTISGCWKGIREPDFHFMIQYSRDLKKSIAFTNKFEEWEIEKTLAARPWGPGIMLEAVLPVAAFVKPRKIYTLGWDYANPEIHKETGNMRVGHYYSFEQQKKYNNIAEPPVPFENELCIKNSYHWKEYFEKKKIELIVLSKNSYVDSRIIRKTIDELAEKEGKNNDN